MGDLLSVHRGFAVARLAPVIIKFSEEVRLFQNETKVPKLTLRIGSRRGIWFPDLKILAETYQGRVKVRFILNTGNQIYSWWNYVIGLN